MAKVFWQEYTWKELEASLPRLELVLLPVGSVEQHGPHLPLANDTLAVTAVCEGAAQRLHPRVLVAPTIAFGYSAHHLCKRFPGTLTLRAETLGRVICDIARSLKLWGVKSIVIVNGHGGNRTSISLAAERMRTSMGLAVGYVDYWTLIPSSVYERNMEKGGYSARHAGEFETSVALALFPNLVRTDYLRGLNESKLGEQRVSEEGWKPRISRVAYTDEHRPSGFSDDPRAASELKGRTFTNAAVDGLVAAIEDFLAFKPRYTHTPP